MLLDRPQITEGSEIVNATVSSGTVDPQLPNVGELFYRTDLDELRAYTTSGWVVVASGANIVGTHVSDSSLHLSPDQNTLLDGLNLPTLTATALNYAADVTAPIQSQINDLVDHTIDDNRHLTTEQNSLLDGITVTPTEVNALPSLIAHAGDETIHITPAQDLFLDGLDVSLSSADLNRSVGLDAYLASVSIPSTATALTTLFISKLDKSGGTVTGNIVMSGAKVTGLPNPVFDTDAANKAYVDAMGSGIDWKEAVAAATTSNIVLSGLQSIDGVTLIAGDRVLVKDQTDDTENGVYVVDTGPWSRAADYDDALEVSHSAIYVLEGGAVNGRGSFVQSKAVTIFPGEAISFAPFSGPVINTAGAGVDLAPGGTVSVKEGAGLAFDGSSNLIVDVYSGGGLMTTIDGDTSSTAGSAQLSLTKIGTAGTYRSISVDSYGRVTAGTNPTTIAEYGITDAVLKTGDTMSGALNLPVDGLVVGTTQLVATNGNIGVGTNAPTTYTDYRTLAVNGTNGGVLEFQANGVQQSRITSESNSLIVHTNGVERLRVDSTGNVGIGTNLPSAKLEVAGMIYTTTGGIKFPDNSIQTTAGVSTSAGGSTGQVQYNNAGAFAGATNVSTNGTVLTVGSTSLRTLAGGFTPTIQLEETSGVDKGVLAVIKNTTETDGAKIVIGRSNGAVTGSQTAVPALSKIGELSFEGAFGGASLHQVATVTAATTDATWSDSTGRGMLALQTTNNGSSSAVGTRISVLGTSNSSTLYGYTGTEGFTIAGTNAVGLANPVSAVTSNSIVFDPSGALLFKASITPEDSIKLLGSTLSLGVTARTSVAGHSSVALMVENQAESARTPVIAAVSNSVSASEGGVLALGRTRSTTSNQHTAVSNGDVLGSIRFFGANGTNTNTVGSTIESVASGAFSTTSSPSYLTFNTTATGSVSPVERVRVDAVGVGIGVAPTEKLHVNGLARLQGSTTDLYLGSDATGAFAAVYSNHSLRFITNNVERVRVTGSGNVGIGLSTVSENLSVGTTTASSDVTIGLRALTSASASSRTVITQGADTGSLTVNWNAGGVGSEGALILVSGASERLRINSAGKITSTSSVSGDALVVLQNTSATGNGVRIDGGSSTSTYALSVRNNSGSELVQVNGAGAMSIGAAPVTNTKFYVNGAVAQNVTAVAATSIDWSAGNYFTKTISGATTFTFTNFPPSGFSMITLKITDGGSATITWPTSVKWSNGAAPALSATGVDILNLFTDDGGVTVYGILAGKGMA